MRIDLTNYNSVAGSLIKIYRSYQVFTEDKCPPPLVTLPIETTEYHDTTVALNRIAYYRIGIVHNDSEVIGPMYTTVKKYYTGPQVNLNRTDEPDSILRGDAKVGRYGELSLDDVYPLSQATQDLISLTLIDGLDYQSVKLEKCIFEDTIFFIPNKPVLYGSLEDLYNDGILFPTGDGAAQLSNELYTSLTTKVMQGKKVHSKGFTYRLRLLTLNEFKQLYSKLYPTSVIGIDQERVIANCTPHTYRSPVLSSSRITLNDNIRVGLDGVTDTISWLAKSPLFTVLELVSRSDTAFPDVNGIVKPTLPDDRMMYSNAEIVNDRVHFFGGIYSTFTTGRAASNRHISFDLNGENEKVHAPMPVGVYKSITWTHNNKIYCFGGVKSIGTTEWGFTELYNDVQVWEDDGTDEGVWKTLTSNVTYGFDSMGTVYHDSGVDKDILLIFGGYTESQPGILDYYYYADVNTFNGTFEKAKAYLSQGGGGAIHAYGANIMTVGIARSGNSYTNATMRIPLPIDPPKSFYLSSVTTQGNELPATKGGRIHEWRDTLLLATSASITKESDKIYLYQWAANESRWLKITVNAIGVYSNSRPVASVIFNNNRGFALLCQPWLNNTSESQLVVFDLVDPLDADLTSINNINVTVDRIYAPFAQVTN